MKRSSCGPAPAVAMVPLVAMATLVLAVGCRSAPPVSGAMVAPGRTTTITEAEIVAMGAPSAWEVVRTRAPRFFAAGGDGQPAGVRIQERRSVNADETPLLVVDGAQAYDLTWLTQIPASEIAFIRILDAEAAEPLYGLRAAGGAIIVVTKGAR